MEFQLKSIAIASKIAQLLEHSKRIPISSRKQQSHLPATLQLVHTKASNFERCAKRRQQNASKRNNGNDIFVSERQRRRGQFISSAKIWRLWFFRRNSNSNGEIFTRRARKICSGKKHDKRCACHTEKQQKWGESYFSEDINASTDEKWCAWTGAERKWN